MRFFNLHYFHVDDINAYSARRRGALRYRRGRQRRSRAIYPSLAPRRVFPQGYDISVMSAFRERQRFRLKSPIIPNVVCSTLIFPFLHYSILQMCTRILDPLPAP